MGCIYIAYTFLVLLTTQSILQYKLQSPTHMFIQHFSNAATHMNATSVAIEYLAQRFLKQRVRDQTTTLCSA